MRSASMLTVLGDPPPALCAQVGSESSHMGGGGNILFFGNFWGAKGSSDRELFLESGSPLQTKPTQ